MPISNTITRSHAARRGNLLVGCGIAVVVVVAIVIALGVWVAMSWKGWAAGAVTAGVDAAMTQAQVDPAEQSEIMVHVEELTGRFERGDITTEQFFTVMESLGDSPLVALAAVSVMNNTYIEGSALESDEKADARTQLLRYAMGVREGDIDLESVETVLTPLEDPSPGDSSIRFTISVDPASGQTRELVLKSPSSATEDDIRAVVEEAKTLADDAGAPESPEPIDLSDEVERAINDALAGTGATPLGEGSATDADPDEGP